MTSGMRPPISTQTASWLSANVPGADNDRRQKLLKHGKMWLSCCWTVLVIVRNHQKRNEIRWVDVESKIFSLFVGQKKYIVHCGVTVQMASHLRLCDVIVCSGHSQSRYEPASYPLLQHATRGVAHNAIIIITIAEDRAASSYNVHAIRVGHHFGETWLASESSCQQVSSASCAAVAIALTCCRDERAGVDFWLFNAAATQNQLSRQFKQLHFHVNVVIGISQLISHDKTELMAGMNWCWR